VVGVQDVDLGQAVKALVVLAPDAGVTAAAVVRHCRRHLESHMVPKVVEIVGALPRTHTGKVARGDLR
jgi:acyl-coenzyme A synthetase/AMP-(fatty) acid ligase